MNKGEMGDVWWKMNNELIIYKSEDEFFYKMMDDVLFNGKYQQQESI